MSPKNLPFESSSTSSPFDLSCEQARRSISDTVFFVYESATSMLFHSSLVTESISTSASPPKPSAACPSAFAGAGAACGADMERSAG